MNIITVDNNNIKLLETFIENIDSENFRYYNTRNINIIKNHSLTLLGIVDGNPIAYGLIDKDNNYNWLGICVLSKYQSKGYGNKIFSQLIEFVNLRKLKNVQLSVDINNTKAIKLYLKYNFTITNKNSNSYILKYNIQFYKKIFYKTFFSYKYNDKHIAIGNCIKKT